MEKPHKREWEIRCRKKIGKNSKQFFHFCHRRHCSVQKNRVHEKTQNHLILICKIRSKPPINFSLLPMVFRSPTTQRGMDELDRRWKEAKKRRKTKVRERKSFYNAIFKVFTHTGRWCWKVFLFFSIRVVFGYLVVGERRVRLDRIEKLNYFVVFNILLQIVWWCKNFSETFCMWRCEDWSFF